MNTNKKSTNKKEPVITPKSLGLVDPVNFNNLYADEQVFAHLYNIILQCYKYYYEPFYEATLDNTNTNAIHQCLGDWPFKKGGVNYINQMFPDRYKDEKNIPVYTDEKDYNKYVRLSISEAWARYATPEFGDFVVPQKIIQYVIEARKENYVKDSNIPQDKKRFEDAKNVANLFLKETKINSFAIYSIMGALFVECGWSFDGKVYNSLEYAGGGAAGTDGKKGCGECWFGLTFWYQKEKIINKLNPPGINYNSSASPPAGMLTSLDRSWQCKIMEAYMESLPKYHVENLFMENKPNYSDEERESILYSTYLWKAGCGYKPTFEDMKECTAKYKATHKKQSKSENFKPNDGFALQIYIAILFSLYIKEDKIYTPAEIDKKIGV